MCIMYVCVYNVCVCIMYVCIMSVYNACVCIMYVCVSESVILGRGLTANNNNHNKAKSTVQLDKKLKERMQLTV